MITFLRFVADLVKNILFKIKKIVKVKTSKFSAASCKPSSEYMARVITPLFIMSIVPLDFTDLLI
jgi:hypothetical protein